MTNKNKHIHKFKLDDEASITQFCECGETTLTEDFKTILHTNYDKWQKKIIKTI